MHVNKLSNEYSGQLFQLLLLQDTAGTFGNNAVNIFLPSLFPSLPCWSWSAFSFFSRVQDRPELIEIGESFLLLSSDLFHGPHEIPRIVFFFPIDPDNKTVHLQTCTIRFFNFFVSGGNSIGTTVTNQSQIAQFFWGFFSRENQGYIFCSAARRADKSALFSVQCRAVLLMSTRPAAHPSVCVCNCGGS